jgi:hypothetical protein
MVIQSNNWTDRVGFDNDVAMAVVEVERCGLMVAVAVGGSILIPK